MIIGIDTSTNFLKLGVFEKEVISELVLNVRDSHTKHLLNSLNFILASNRIDREQIEAFGVIVGPGSFTGLRIGLATVIGIAAAWGTPIHPLISGDIVWRANLKEIETEHFFYLLDGKRRELFLFHYIRATNGFSLSSEVESMSYKEAFLEITRRRKGGVTIAGEGIDILKKEGFIFSDKHKLIDKPYNGYSGGDIARFTMAASTGPVKNPEPLYIRDADIRT
ncbi:MAG TPA: tRNA (adenosine(37)-N6)-threonylcarbamoyltransferase complex dimerization subunit type 1 TsaB [Firmicutes bacterium]|nr:tRNA (adenosine(37)-N6)-threonylcarbamoyltransferase complex dimerization subunit type 1 TsaB [Bacillota bacterium]